MCFGNLTEEFLGAFLGSLTPIGAFLFQQWYQEMKLRKNRHTEFCNSLELICTFNKNSLNENRKYLNSTVAKTFDQDFTVDKPSVTFLRFNDYELPALMFKNNDCLNNKISECVQEILLKFSDLRNYEHTLIGTYNEAKSLYLTSVPEHKTTYEKMCVGSKGLRIKMVQTIDDLMTQIYKLENIISTDTKGKQEFLSSESEAL